MFMIIAAVQGAGKPHLPAIGVDALMSGLVVLALLRVGATRWSGQFALVPLAVLLQALDWSRPRLDGRTAAGMLLLLLATVFLLLPPGPDGPPELDLL